MSRGSISVCGVWCGVIGIVIGESEGKMMNYDRWRDGIRYVGSKWNCA